MKQWNKINWSAINRRIREIEANLQQERPERDDFKAKSTTSVSMQTDHTTAQALMVWVDDGGSAA